MRQGYNVLYGGAEKLVHVVILEIGDLDPIDDKVISKVMELAPDQVSNYSPDGVVYAGIADYDGREVVLEDVLRAFGNTDQNDVKMESLEGAVSILNDFSVSPQHDMHLRCMIRSLPKVAKISKIILNKGCHEGSCEVDKDE